MWKNYNRFYKAIKEKYPQIEVICALMFSPYIQDAEKIEILDPHYYETAVGSIIMQMFMINCPMIFRIKSM